MWRDRQTDGRADMTKAVGAFHDSAKAPKNYRSTEICLLNKSFITYSTT